MVSSNMVSRLSGSLHSPVSGRVALSSRHRGCSMYYPVVSVGCMRDRCVRLDSAAHIRNAEESFVKGKHKMYRDRLPSSM